MLKNRAQLISFFEHILLVIIAGLTYLLFASKFGYFNDDWYLMYAAGTKGPSAFWGIFAVDRPLRALVMIPAYSLFGSNPIYYNLSAFFFRVLSGFFLLWVVRLLWKENRTITLWVAILFLLYPGFLSQPNAIDYLCHLVGFALGILSIAFTIKAIQSNKWQYKLVFYFLSVFSGWFCLWQIEWYIGLEFFRFACIFLLSFRVQETTWLKFSRFVKYSLPSTLIPGVFLIWRFFFFKSERGATDADLQLGNIRSEPMAFLQNFILRLFDDIFDVLVRAWRTPLTRLSIDISRQDWIVGYSLALLVVLLVFFVSFLIQGESQKEIDDSNWRQEAIGIALGMLVFGLIPVLLVGRTVDFKSFSRYTLVSSLGAALLWPMVLSYIPIPKLRNFLFGVLVFSASLTHYANGLVHAKSSEATRDFWWQVAWRIPQMEPGTTLVAHYSVVAEEDYFTWGPANLIYYPKSNSEKYIQPAVYAALLNQETVSKVLAREAKDYSNRRSIRTYPNYKNILILTKPTSESCVQIIDLNQVELSSSEDSRIVAISPFSEAEHIYLNEPFHTPPVIPFGVEPAYGWCYYYEKAAYARQTGNWDEVTSLGEKAFSLNLTPTDQIEWMPFLQAYAYSDTISRLSEISLFMKSDTSAREQACQILKSKTLTPSTALQVQQLFCQ